MLEQVTAFERIEPYLDDVTKEVDPQAIQRAREAREWSREQLAQLLGVSSASIFRWEHGLTKPVPALARAVVEFINDTNRVMERRRRK